MIKKTFQPCILILFLAIVGCSSPQPNIEIPISTVDTIPGYPVIIVKTENSAYPPPEKIDPTSIQTLSYFNIPTPEPGKASVYGSLVNFSTFTLMSNVDIYLTRAIGKDHNQVPPILFGALEKNGDIEGKTNFDGQFVFSNIPPGNYYLIVSMDLSPVTSKNATTMPLLIEVKPDTIIKLGTVYYSGN